MGLSESTERKYVVKAVLERPARYNASRTTAASPQQLQAGPSQLVQLTSPSSSTPIIQSPMPERQIVRIESTTHEVHDQ